MASSTDTELACPVIAANISGMASRSFSSRVQPRPECSR